MPRDVMIMHVVDTEQQTESPWASQLRRYREQKARTAAAWAGIYERRRFVLQHCSMAPCLPARWGEEG